MLWSVMPWLAGMCSIYAPLSGCDQLALPPYHAGQINYKYQKVENLDQRCAYYEGLQKCKNKQVCTAKSALTSYSSFLDEYASRCLLLKPKCSPCSEEVPGAWRRPCCSCTRRRLRISDRSPDENTAISTRRWRSRAIPPATREFRSFRLQNVAPFEY